MDGALEAMEGSGTSGEAEKECDQEARGKRQELQAGGGCGGHNLKGRLYKKRQRR